MGTYIAHALPTSPALPVADIANRSGLATRQMSGVGLTGREHGAGLSLHQTRGEESKLEVVSGTGTV